MWERACSRMRCINRHQCCLTHRIREQARSHRGFVSSLELAPIPITRNRRTTHVVKRVRPVQDWHRPFQLPHRRPDACRCALRRRPAPR
ncbi:hypothetical protein E4T63_21440 [Pseudomonas fluorescens]|uniref:Uncharacterized protein n=1 Tax=Pseudomonas fluorescens TaxID=294 RepID=A0AAP9CK61_PSEFL|nr:hypothetical protein E4T63_21440 [Pseudomonas fluorescens]